MIVARETIGALGTSEERKAAVDGALKSIKTMEDA